ncbi:transposase domain-containing protein [Prodigiosinella confusarubida]|uniref:transposase domain-containing protein n=1 Tax=Serratia sp. (strain ATCC 39006) TaxID=104623 RepID=UPI0012FE858B
MPIRACSRLYLNPLNTARLNAHDPYIWLRDALTRLPTYKYSSIHVEKAWNLDLFS